MGYGYVVAAIVALALLIGAHEVGHRRGSAVGKAELAAYQAEAEKEKAQLREAAATATARVVVQYRDRVQVIREVPPEVIHELEVLRKSDCVLPPEFRVLHDDATGNNASEAGGAAKAPAPVDCATAAETIRANYRAARENAAQLEALQEWAASVTR